MRPLLLDLFCCAGGAAKGYYEAGFDIVGVDIKPQPTYPYTFIKGDVLDLLPVLIATYRPAAIHASPTCQRKARVTAWRGNRESHPNTLTPTLAMLRSGDIPYVVENVPEAADELRPDLMLCGTHFDLNVRRHRVFEVGGWAVKPPERSCNCYRNPDLIPFGHKNERAFADAMGCTWMSNLSARQAIPPAYTQFIGAQLIGHLS